MPSLTCQPRIALLIITLLGSNSAAAETIEDMQRRYLESISTSDGKAYESVAAAQLTDDLRFLPECARDEKVASGAVTLYYEIAPSGRVSSVYLFPQTVLNDCVRDALGEREFSPPPVSWTGRMTLTISR